MDKSKKLVRYNKLKIWKIEDPYNIPEEINFKKDRRLIEKIWFLKAKMDVETSCNDSMVKIPFKKNYRINKSFYVFKPIENKEYLDKIYKELMDLHKNYKKNKLYRHYYKEGGYHVYMEEKLKNGKLRNLYGREFLDKIENYYPYTHSYILNVLNLIVNCNKKFNKKNLDYVLDKVTKMIILRYDPKKGKKLHIDNIWRTNGGFILTISIGPKNIYYDLVPISKQIDKKNYRISINDGDIVIMDGESRILYGHSVPHDCDYKNKYKFSLVLMFNKSEVIKTNEKYNDILKDNIITSFMSKIKECKIE